MNTRIQLLVALLGALTLGSRPFGQQRPSWLLVTNKTGTTVELFVRVRDAWQSRSRISPNETMPVYNVATGQCFRAVWGARAKDVVLKLVYDRTYGGFQQEWELPGRDPDRPCRASAPEHMNAMGGP